MASYLITYTIKNDDVRESINDFLEAQGFNQNVDQSTRFGNFNGKKEQLIIILQNARKTYQMNKKDTLFLFYSGKNKNDEHSIFMKEIL